MTTYKYLKTILLVLLISTSCHAKTHEPEFIGIYGPNHYGITTIEVRWGDNVYIGEFKGKITDPEVEKSYFKWFDTIVKANK